MAITAAAGSSGLDVASVVSQLMVVEHQPVDALNKKISSYQTKLSAYGTIQSLVSTFRSSVQALEGSGSFQSFTATSSDSSILTGTASSSALAGSYTVNVSSLAHAQQLVSVGQASSAATIGDGSTTTLSFDFGTVGSGSSFTSNGGGVKTVTIDSTNNTLAGIRDAINAANIGVSATLINDGGTSPYRLALSSSASGASNTMKVSVAGTSSDTSISDLLSYDPAGTKKLTETVAGTNANFTVNGVAISKSMNTVTDAIQGVTLNLNNTSGNSVTLKVSSDTTAITNAANTFVTAYNALYSNMKSQTSYDATSKSGSTLQGDSGVIGMISQMRKILTASVGSGAFTSLSQIGFSSATDGTLSLDTTKFQAALASNQSDVQNILASSNGIAKQFDQWASQSNTFTISSRTSGINQNISDINHQIGVWNSRLATIQARYIKQYTALDGVLSSMNNTQTYLTQQIATFNANSKA